MHNPPPSVASMLGQKFHKLLIKSFEGVKEWGSGRGYLVKCLCDCGCVVVIATKNIRSGRTKSCGCHRRVDHPLEDREKMIAELLQKRAGLHKTDPKEYDRISSKITRLRDPEAHRERSRAYRLL